MPVFARSIPRAILLLGALAVFCLLPPETLAQGPDLCLWRKLLHLSSCPACGTSRALAAFFHARFAEALAFNRNVVLTAPGLVLLLTLDALQGLKKFGSLLLLSFPSSSGMNRLPKKDSISGLPKHAQRG